MFYPNAEFNDAWIEACTRELEEGEWEEACMRESAEREFPQAALALTRCAYGCAAIFAIGGDDERYFDIGVKVLEKCNNG